jgi:radical SAM protein with 4Fe4S-binding SPASM domain
VSIHGPNAEIHERLTGAGTFSKALKGTELLLRHIPAEKVTINCTLSEWNLDWIEQMIELAEKLGVGRIRFMPLHRAKVRREDQPTLDYRSKKLENWARIASEGLVRQRWPVEVSFGFTGLPGATCEELELASQLPCEVGRKLVVTADGRIYPCALLMSSEFLLGHLEEGLDMLISSPAFRNLVATLQNRYRTVPRCQGCALGGICRGGCPALAWQTSGDFNQPDPLCASNLAYSSNYFSLVTRQKTTPV